MKMAPPTVTVPERRPGRRPIDPDGCSVQVGVTLPSKQFDDLCRRARAAGVSVPEMIRRDLLKKSIK